MMIKANGIELCAETFGDRRDPAMLLIGGAASSMDWWEDEFCRRLAGAGHFVIRYDNRDTGQSTSSPAGAPDYTGRDLTDDALRVLDGLGISEAHIVGISMGGGIAQELAIEHPVRVISLTLMSTSPGGDDLPPWADHLEQKFANPGPGPDWTDREAVIQSFVDAERDFSGSLPVDEERIRRIAGRMFDRTRDMAAAQTNHWILEGGDSLPIRPRLGRISAPTLVIHGTRDPLFPLPHAQALAREIPDATLLPIEGMGHQMPPPQVWGVVIPAIVSLSHRWSATRSL